MYIALIQQYSLVPGKPGPIYHDITYGTAITVAESELELRITTNTAYIVIPGELWGVCYEEFGDNWPRCNGTTLYVVISLVEDISSVNVVAIQSVLTQCWHWG